MRIDGLFVILPVMRRFVVFIILMLALCSCRAVSSIVHDDQVVAKVGKDKLYKSELEGMIPALISAEDSTRLAEQYIRSWATDRLYLQVAEQQLSKSELDVSEELERYRISLVRYRYEQLYLNTRLDTLITDEQVKEYYNSHNEDFLLSRPLLKVRFVDVMRDSPNKDEILKMMTSDKYDDVEYADSLAMTSTLRYFDNSDTWMDARDLARAFGVDYEYMLGKMRNNMIIIEPEGRNDILAAYVCDIISGGIAPLDYCTPAIRDIIMSNRKRELLESLERDLLESALGNKQFVIY